MRKVRIYIAMSLDGYIADKNGSVDWLNGDGSDRENPGSYPEFIESVDTVILGCRTYDQIVTELSPEVWPYAGKETYVLTHRDCANQPGITFINQNAAHLLAKLKKEQKKDIRLFNQKEPGQKLKFVSARSYNGIVDLTYRI